MTHYVGILDGAKNVWGVRIPDLPGCFGGGSSPEAAISDIISAMREWAGAIAQKGQPIPPPRPLADIIADNETDYEPQLGESIVMLPLLHETGRSVKANISIDVGMLAAIDAAANVRGMTRSAFLVAAARAMIERAAT